MQAAVALISQSASLEARIIIFGSYCLAPDHLGVFHIKFLKLEGGREVPDPLSTPLGLLQTG